MKDSLIFDITDAGTIADSDSVGAYLRSSDGTLLTHTTDGAREALDVFTELGHLEDSAHVSGDVGAFMLAVRNDVEGSLVSADGDYAPLQVDSLGRLRVIADIDVGNEIEKAEDSAHVSGDIGAYMLAVRADTRPTNANTSTDGDYASLFVNTNGELYVKATDSDALLTTIDADTGTISTNTTTLVAGTHLEDAAHASGDRGYFSLAVRNDAGTALAADGDYIPFTTNASGALYTAVTGTVTVTDAALANTDLVAASTSVDTTAGGTDLRATDLTNRKYLFVYNFGNRRIYIGETGVTSATGFPVSPGSYLELRAGAAQDVYAIAEAGTQDIRTLELS